MASWRGSASRAVSGSNSGPNLDPKRTPNGTPEGTRGRPRGAQTGSRIRTRKWTRKGPETDPQRWPKMGPKTAQIGSKKYVGLWSFLGWRPRPAPRLPEAPPGPKMDQNGPQTGPKMIQNGPESAKMDWNGSQDAPKRPPNGPETPPWTRSAACAGTDRSGRERAQPPSDRGQWGRPVTRASVLNPAVPLAACVN